MDQVPFGVDPLLCIGRFYIWNNVLLWEKKKSQMFSPDAKKGWKYQPNSIAQFWKCSFHERNTNTTIMSYIMFYLIVYNNELGLFLLAPWYLCKTIKSTSHSLTIKINYHNCVYHIITNFSLYPPPHLMCCCVYCCEK